MEPLASRPRVRRRRIGTAFAATATAIFTSATVAMIAYHNVGDEKAGDGGPPAAAEREPGRGLEPGGGPGRLAAAAARSAATAARVHEVAAEPTASPASAVAVEPATRAEGAPGDVDACMRPLFAGDTFEAGILPGFSFACRETDPRRGADTMKSAVVRAAGNKQVSTGMREWAILGWYEMAAFGVLRARCCLDPAPLELPAPPGACPSLQAALRELSAAAVAASSDDDARVQAALDAYATAVRCVAKSGAAKLYGQRQPPQGGEDTSFKKTLARVIAARGGP